MNADFKAIEKRTVRSFYEDGLSEIALGAIFLLLGGYFFAETTLPEGGFLHSLLVASFVLVIVFGGLLVNRILRWLKRRITYPRAGFVSFRKDRDPKRRRIAGVSAAIIAALFSTLLGLSASFRTLLPAINGLLLGVALLLMAIRIGALRFHILAVVSAAIGVGLVALGYGDTPGLCLHYALFGSAVTLSGLVTLILFLRRHRLDGEAADER